MVEDAMTAREEILTRVRQSLAAAPQPEPVRRDYRQPGTLADADRIALFVSRLEDYNAGVYRCTATELRATIGQALAARNKSSVVIPAGFPADLLPTGPHFIRDEALDYAAIDATEGALTLSTGAIALTGSIILTHSAAEGRRALTLIPDYHLCVVYTHQIAETVPEALRALADRRTSPITTIAGPSATADIEMTRVKGVHGPRTLDVIISG